MQLWPASMLYNAHGLCCAWYTTAKACALNGGLMVLRTTACMRVIPWVCCLGASMPMHAAWKKQTCRQRAGAIAWSMSIVGVHPKMLKWGAYSCFRKTSLTREPKRTLARVHRASYSCAAPEKGDPAVLSNSCSSRSSCTQSLNSAGPKQAWFARLRSANARCPYHCKHQCLLCPSERTEEHTSLLETGQGDPSSMR